MAKVKQYKSKYKGSDIDRILDKAEKNKDGVTKEYVDSEVAKKPSINDGETYTTDSTWSSQHSTEVFNTTIGEFNKELENLRDSQGAILKTEVTLTSSTQDTNGHYVKFICENGDIYYSEEVNKFRVADESSFNFIIKLQPDIFGHLEIINGTTTLFKTIPFITQSGRGDYSLFCDYNNKTYIFDGISSQGTLEAIKELGGGSSPLKPNQQALIDAWSETDVLFIGDDPKIPQELDWKIIKNGAYLYSHQFVGGKWVEYQKIGGSTQVDTLILKGLHTAIYETANDIKSNIWRSGSTPNSNVYGSTQRRVFVLANNRDNCMISYAGEKFEFNASEDGVVEINETTMIKDFDYSYAWDTEVIETVHKLYKPTKARLSVLDITDGLENARLIYESMNEKDFNLTGGLPIVGKSGETIGQVAMTMNDRIFFIVGRKYRLIAQCKTDDCGFIGVGNFPYVKMVGNKSEASMVITKGWLDENGVGTNIFNYTDKKSYVKDDFIFYKDGTYRAYVNTDKMPNIVSTKRYSDKLIETSSLSNSDNYDIQIRVAQNLTPHVDCIMSGLTFSCEKAKFPFDTYVVLYENELDVFANCVVSKFEKVTITQSNQDIIFLEPWKLSQKKSYKFGLTFIGDKGYSLGVTDGVTCIDNPAIKNGINDIYGASSSYNGSSISEDITPVLGKSVHWSSRLRNKMFSISPKIEANYCDWIQIENPNEIDSISNENLNLRFVSPARSNFYDESNVQFEFGVIENTVQYIKEKGRFQFSKDAVFKKEEEFIRFNFQDMYLKYWDGMVSIEFSINPPTEGAPYHIEPKTIFLLDDSDEVVESDILITDEDWQGNKTSYTIVKFTFDHRDGTVYKANFGANNDFVNCYANITIRELPEIKNMPLFQTRNASCLHEWVMPDSYEETVKCAGYISYNGDGKQVLANNGEYIDAGWDKKLNLKSENVAVTFENGNVGDVKYMTFTLEQFKVTSPTGNILEPTFRTINNIDEIVFTKCNVIESESFQLVYNGCKPLTNTQVKIIFKGDGTIPVQINPDAIILRGISADVPYKYNIVEISEYEKTLVIDTNLPSDRFRIMFGVGNDFTNSACSISYQSDYVEPIAKTENLFVNNKINPIFSDSWDMIVDTTINQNIDIIKNSADTTYTLVHEIPYDRQADWISNEFITIDSIVPHDDISMCTHFAIVGREPFVPNYTDIYVKYQLAMDGETSKIYMDGVAHTGQPIIYNKITTPITNKKQLSLLCNSLNDPHGNLPNDSYDVRFYVYNGQQIHTPLLDKSTHLLNEELIPRNSTGFVYLNDKLRIKADNLSFVFESSPDDINWREVGRFE